MYLLLLFSYSELNIHYNQVHLYAIPARMFINIQSANRNHYKISAHLKYKRANSRRVKFLAASAHNFSVRACRKYHLMAASITENDVVISLRKIRAMNAA